MNTCHGCGESYIYAKTIAQTNFVSSVRALCELELACRDLCGIVSCSVICLLLGRDLYSNPGWKLHGWIAYTPLVSVIFP